MCSGKPRRLFYEYVPTRSMVTKSETIRPSIRVHTHESDTNIRYRWTLVRAERDTVENLPPDARRRDARFANQIVYKEVPVSPECGHDDLDFTRILSRRARCVWLSVDNALDHPLESLDTLVSSLAHSKLEKSSIAFAVSSDAGGGTLQT